MNMKEKLESLGKNSIRLKIARKETYKLGATRFGGKPDVPPDFVWPTGAMTPMTRAVPASIGLRIFRRCPLQTFLRIWRKISNFLWSRSK